MSKHTRQQPISLIKELFTYFKSNRELQLGRIQFIDKTMILIIILYSIFSVGMIYSASMIGNQHGLFTSGVIVTEYYFAVRQLIWCVIGILLLLGVAYFLPYELYRNGKFMKYSAIIIIIMLLITRFFGDVNGSYGWIKLPGGFNIQPVEFAKLYIIIYFAYILETRNSELIYNNLRGMRLYTIFTLPVFILAIIIIWENDFGSAIIIVAIISVMFLTSKIRLRNLSHILGIGAVAISIFTLIKYLIFGYVFSPYQINRFKSWIDPFSDIEHSSYNLYNSLIAIGNGGIFGRGLGNSVQKLGFLPEAHTDFIFAVIAEELGLIGVLIILSFLSYLFFKIINGAKQAPTTYAAQICVGYVTWITIQAVFNLGGVSGAVPLTGVPLPFLSYGGSSMLALCLGMGIVLNVLAHIVHRQPKK